MRKKTIEQIHAGDICGKNIYSYSRNNDNEIIPELLVARGIRLTEAIIHRLHERQIFELYVEEPGTEDVKEAEELVPSRVRLKLMNNLSREMKLIDQKILEQFHTQSLDYVAESLVEDKKYTAIIDKIEFDRKLFRSMAQQLFDSVLKQKKEIIPNLYLIQTHDDYTFRHSIDVAIFAIWISRLINWVTKATLEDVIIGCLLHDVGKRFIPKEILNYPGKLPESHMKYIHAHPSIGYELIRAQGFSHMSAHVAFQHHERQDGQGYPQGLMGFNRIHRPRYTPLGYILLIAEITAVADTMDAMSSNRTYRHRLPHDIAVRNLQYAISPEKKQLNYEIVKEVLRFYPSYPAGENIEIYHPLSHPLFKAQGIVLENQFPSIERPRIRLLYNADGKRLREPIDISLVENEDVMIRCTDYLDDRLKSIFYAGQG